MLFKVNSAILDWFLSQNIIFYFKKKKKINKFWYYGEAENSVNICSLGEADYRWSTAGRVTSAREIEIEWLGQVFSQPA